MAIKQIGEINISMLHYLCLIYTRTMRSAFVWHENVPKIIDVFKDGQFRY